MSFDQAVSFVLGPDIEGGFGNDPQDPGNWTSGKAGIGYLNGTKYGISAAAYPHIDIEKLTLDAAKEIYYRDYWMKIGGDILGALGIPVFDEAVNGGQRMAIMLLQATLGIEQDGNIGPLTRTAIAKADINELIMWFAVNRIIHYSLCNGWTQNKRGWVHRAVKSTVLAVNSKGE